MVHFLVIHCEYTHKAVHTVYFVALEVNLLHIECTTVFTKNYDPFLFLHAKMNGHFL